jgi:hypothetical protein
MSIQHHGKGRGGFNTSFVLEGEDYVGELNVGGSSLTGSVLYDTLIHPLAFAGTRSAAFAQLFDKYVYENITFEYHPIVDATTSGAFVGYCDYDPNDDVVSALATNVRRAASHQGMAFNQLFVPDKWSMKEIKKDALYFCDPSNSEDRLAYQGRFIVIQASDNADVNPITAGLITVKYKLHLFIQQLTEVTPVGASYYEFVSQLASCTADTPFGVGQSGSGLNWLGVNMPFFYNGFGFTAPNVASLTQSYMIELIIVGTGFTGFHVESNQDGVFMQTTILSPNVNSSTQVIMSIIATQDRANGYGNDFFAAFTTLTTVTTARIRIFALPPVLALRGNLSPVERQLAALRTEMKVIEERLSDSNSEEPATPKSRAPSRPQTLGPVVQLFPPTRRTFTPATLPPTSVATQPKAPKGVPPG